MGTRGWRSADTLERDEVAFPLPEPDRFAEWVHQEAWLARPSARIVHDGTAVVVRFVAGEPDGEWSPVPSVSAGLHRVCGRCLVTTVWWCPGVADPHLVRRLVGPSAAAVVERYGAGVRRGPGSGAPVEGPVPSQGEVTVELTQGEAATLMERWRSLTDT